MNTPHRESLISWYAVQTHPRQEERAESNLVSWKVETFAPKYLGEVRRAYGTRRAPVAKPLFPSYIFARFDVQQMAHKIRFTRGIRSIISFGEVPAPIEDELIDLIKSRRQADGFIRLNDEIKCGDPVLVKEGSFGGLTGVFERKMKDSRRVTILLEAVNKQFHLTIPQDHITRLTASQ